MLLRYAPFALLLASPALAQNLDVPENPAFPTTFNQPMLTVNSPAELQRAFHNGVMVGEGDIEEMFAAPYFLPDLSLEDGRYVVGASVFTDVCLDADDEDGDGLVTDTLRQIDLAPPLFDPAVTPQAGSGVLTDPITGIDYEGIVTGTLVQTEPAIGCDPDTNGPVTLTNADAVIGEIAFIQYGGCSYSAKAVTAQRAGARGVVIYLPGSEGYPERFGATNMAATLTGSGLDDDLYTATDSLGLYIPVLQIPAGVAGPLIDDLEFGSEVNVTLGVGPVSLIPGFEGETQQETPYLTDCMLASGWRLGGIHGDPPFARLASSCPIRTAGAPPPAATRATLAAYPNPSAHVTRVRLATPRPERVRVAAFDLLGRRVALLHDGPVAGTADLALDVSALPAGLYVVLAVGETFRETARFSVAR